MSNLGGNLGDHGGGFRKVARVFRNANQFALLVVRPQAFRLATAVVCNHGVGAFENAAGGAVVLFQLDDLGVRVGFFEIENVADVGTAEMVDRLVVVTHDTEVVLRLAPVVDVGRQELHQAELRRVGVLVLVHKNMFKTVLVVGQSHVVGLQQFHRLHQQIVEVEGVVLLKILLVRLIGAGHIAVGGAVHIPEILRAHQLIFRLGDNRKNRLRRKPLHVNVEALKDVPHGALLVVGVVDDEVGRIADGSAETS